MTTVKAAILAAVLAFSPAYIWAEEPPRDTPGLQNQVKANEIIFFYTSGCGKCRYIEYNILPDLQAKYEGNIGFRYLNTAELENYKLLSALKKECGQDLNTTFPVIYLNGRFLGFKGKGGNLALLIDKFVVEALKEPKVVKTGVFDLVDHFRSFTPWAVAGAGLADGINPCAFAVILFFASFLAVQGYGSRALSVIGAVFILGVFIAYIVIGLGLLSFIYKVSAFWEAARIYTLTLGAGSIILGVLSLYDAYAYGKTGEASSVVLKLPPRIKNLIHSLIGRFYRTETRDMAGARSILGLSLISFIAGILVSVLEAVCTGQVYLPTISLIYKTTGYKREALQYIILYNTMFILPLAAIYAVTLFGAGSMKVGNFLRKRITMVKAILAFVFIILGYMLIFSGTSAVLAKDKPDFNGGIVDNAHENPYFFDFGEVIEGETLKHKFFVKNKYNKPLTITQINSSCSCTVPFVKANIIPAKGTVPVVLEFKTKGYPGIKHRYVYVHTDAPNDNIVVLEIRADIKPASGVNN